MQLLHTIGSLCARAMSLTPVKSQVNKRFFSLFLYITCETNKKENGGCQYKHAGCINVTVNILCVSFTYYGATKWSFSRAGRGLDFKMLEFNAFINLLILLLLY